VRQRLWGADANPYLLAASPKKPFEFSPKK